MYGVESLRPSAITITDTKTGQSEVHEVKELPNPRTRAGRNLYYDLFVGTDARDIGKTLDDCRAVLEFFDWAHNRKDEPKSLSALD